MKSATSDLRQVTGKKETRAEPCPKSRGTQNRSPSLKITCWIANQCINDIFRQIFAKKKWFLDQILNFQSCGRLNEARSF